MPGWTPCHYPSNAVSIASISNNSKWYDFNWVDQFGCLNGLGSVISDDNLMRSFVSPPQHIVLPFSLWPPLLLPARLPLPSPVLPCLPAFFFLPVNLNSQPATQYQNKMDLVIIFTEIWYCCIPPQILWNSFTSDALSLITSTSF